MRGPGTNPETQNAAPAFSAAVTAAVVVVAAATTTATATATVATTPDKPSSLLPSALLRFTLLALHREFRRFKADSFIRVESRGHRDVLSLSLFLSFSSFFLRVHIFVLVIPELRRIERKEKERKMDRQASG